MKLINLPTRLTLQLFEQPIAIDTAGFSTEHSNTDANPVANRLRVLAATGQHHYPQSFISHFLLIKINSLLTYALPSLHPLLHRLSSFYNQLQQTSTSTSHFTYSHNDGQLISQIILACNAHPYLSLSDLESITQGSSLVSATIVFVLHSVKLILTKSEYSVVLGLTSLNAQTVPFAAIVHKDKNHQGQIDFAARINSLIHLHKVQTQQKKVVQDAYSMRCTPQVHGVVYDCYYEMLAQFEMSVNRPQGRYILLNGLKTRNLLLQSETETLLLDYLVCSINQIGHMSFLRAERMLNLHTRGSKIKNNENYDYLTIVNKKVSYLLNENKLLASPTNTDTILMDNFRHDIFTFDGLLFRKASKMIENVKSILQMEVQTSLEVLGTMYADQKQLFASQEMQEVYEHLQEMSHQKDVFQTTRLIGQWLKR